MALFQLHAHKPLHHGGEVWPAVACEAGGELRVEQHAGVQAQQGETAQVLTRSVDDPLSVVEHGRECCPRSLAVSLGGDEKCPRPAAAHLH